MEPNYKFKSLPDFKGAHPNLYRQLYKANLVIRLCEDMSWEIPKQPKLRDYWNIKERCFKESEKYNSRSSFKRNAAGAYLSANRNGWLEEICELRGWELKSLPNGYWNIKERCFKESEKYNNIAEFNKNSTSAYVSAKRNGWLEEICELRGWELPRKTLPTGYWNIKENCFKESEKSNSVNNFKKKSHSAYDAALRNGWILEICELRNWEYRKTVKMGYWNIKENCLKESEKSNDVYDFRKNAISAYESSRKNGWLEEICELRGWELPNRVPNGYWQIKENCIKEAEKYNSLYDFRKNSHSAYASACKNNWLDEIKELMNW